MLLRIAICSVPTLGQWLLVEVQSKSWLGWNENRIKSKLKLTSRAWTIALISRRKCVDRIFYKHGENSLQIEALVISY
jgi:hypothetical protein